MAHQFKFGDKVQHEKYGLGVVIGTDKLVRVFFEQGVVFGFYTAKVDDKDYLVSELVLVSGWVDINASTPPTNYEHEGSYISQSVMVTDSEYHGHYIGFGHINDIGEWFIYQSDADFMSPEKVTHWQPIPRPPK